MTTWEVGTECAGRTRCATLDRILWYEDGLTSAVLGHGGPARMNAHTNEEFAKEQGLAGLLVDGMLSTNWISQLLFDHFGEAYLATNYLRTKFIKPIYAGWRITPHFKVTAVENTDKGTLVSMEVWADNEEGTLLTVGEARVTV